MNLAFCVWILMMMMIIERSLVAFKLSFLSDVVMNKALLFVVLGWVGLEALLSHWSFFQVVCFS